MPANPIEAGRKGGQSKSAKKLAAIRRNGFQKQYGVSIPPKDAPVPAVPTQPIPTTATE
jgi:hypothetical protein